MGEYGYSNLRSAPPKSVVADAAVVRLHSPTGRLASLPVSEPPHYKRSRYATRRDQGPRRRSGSVSRVKKLIDLFAKLAGISEESAPFPLPHSRGD